MPRPSGATIKAMAHLIGWLYLFIIVGGLFQQLVLVERLHGDTPQATLRAIADNAGLYRLGIGLSVAFVVCNFVFVWVYHAMLRPVAPLLAPLTLALLLGAAIVEFANLAHLIAPLDIATGKSFATIADDVRAALATDALNDFDNGFAVALILFGLCFMTLAAIFAKATYLPRIFGPLIGVAGLCYVANSLLLFLAPALNRLAFPYILLPTFIAELSLALWLAFAGIKAAAWEQQARQ
jgi:hypothetical protein